MIKVPFPHMALNAENVPGTKYRMWHTWEVESSISPDGMLGWIAKVASGAPEGKLKTLIFNAHGHPGGIKIGAGITRSDASKFSVLKGLVQNIVIVACRVAYIDSAGGDSDGNLFCSDIAKAAKAYVTASTAKQRDDSWFGLPIGYIDDWEGTVLTYAPWGDIYTPVITDL